MSDVRYLLGLHVCVCVYLSLLYIPTYSCGVAHGTFGMSVGDELSRYPGFIASVMHRHLVSLSKGVRFCIELSRPIHAMIP